MGAVEYAHEGDMNALAMDVYEGHMLSFRVRMWFFAGRRIHANMLAPKIHSIPSPT